MRLRYTIRGFLATTSMIMVAFGLAWSYPKSKDVPLFDGNETVALYRGFSYSTNRVFRLLITPPEEDGYWQVEFAGPGSNPYFRYGPSGDLLDQGECNVRVWGEWIWVEFDSSGKPLSASDSSFTRPTKVAKAQRWQAFLSKHSLLLA